MSAIPEQRPDPDPATAVESQAARQVRVFLLDDHELVRRGIRGLVESAPGFVVVGESGSAAAGARAIARVQPDVALLDVRLPDGTGIQVCREIARTAPDVRALMVTTFDDDEARLGAALAGAAGFVLKDISGSALVDALRRVAAGERLLDLAEVMAVIRRRSRTDEPRLAALSGQERRVLDLIVEGLSNRQIGERMSLSEKTVKNYVTNLLDKLGFTRRTEAAVFAARLRP